MNATILVSCYLKVKTFRQTQASFDILHDIVMHNALYMHDYYINIYLSTMSQYGNTLVGIQRNNRGKFQSSTRDTRGNASGLIALMRIDLFIHSDILSALVYVVSQGQPFSWLLKWQQMRASHCG